MPTNRPSGVSAEKGTCTSPISVLLNLTYQIKTAQNAGLDGYNAIELCPSAGNVLLADSIAQAMVFVFGGARVSPAEAN